MTNWYPVLRNLITVVGVIASIALIGHNASTGDWAAALLWLIYLVVLLVTRGFNDATAR